MKICILCMCVYTRYAYTTSPWALGVSIFVQVHAHIICLFVCLFVLDMTDTLHSTAQYTESTALPNYGLAQAWFKALGTQLTL